MDSHWLDCNAHLVGQQVIERTGNIFNQSDADAICFTSNGVVKANGELVMGAGIAKAFRDKWPALAKRAGHCVKNAGNRVHWLITAPVGIGNKHISIVSFPTKHDYKHQSDLRLISSSAEQLVSLTNIYKWNKVYLTRPGCGLGGLDWRTQVRPLLTPILDDRFIILTP